MDKVEKITPEDYILKTRLPFSWQNRFMGMSEYQRYQGYINNMNEVNEFRGINHDEYVKEHGVEKIKQSIETSLKIALSHSHEFIVGWKNQYINLELKQLVKKKPKHLKKLDYKEHLYD